MSARGWWREASAVHFILRGYGGSVHGPHRVVAGDTAARVGDEALLLAEVAPTWIGADRAASARAAVAAGAQVLVMDDGLQNPGLHKDLSLLVVDGASGFGNGRVLPAGPLREPVQAGAARCQAAVLIGPDGVGPLPLPVLRASLRPGPEIAGWVGRRVLAFAGIARPEKFFTMLADAGVIVAATVPFPDHHPFSERGPAPRARRSGCGTARHRSPRRRTRCVCRLSIVIASASLACRSSGMIQAHWTSCWHAMSEVYALSDIQTQLATRHGGARLLSATPRLAGTR